MLTIEGFVRTYEIQRTAEAAVPPRGRFAADLESLITSFKKKSSFITMVLVLRAFFADNSAGRSICVGAFVSGPKTKLEEL